MKQMINMKWHFPKLDHGESEGYNDPLLQYFEGDYAANVAREVIQNSIDARADQGAPVLVIFEKISMPTKNLPGLGELEQRLSVCLKKAKKEKKELAGVYFEKALRAVKGKTISVLRASDFNTTGLTGSDEDPNGKWHKLVKAVGDNEMTGAGGGSFGIGKGAPFAASILRTVYYSTFNSEEQCIFQGKTRLLSHEWKGQDCRGVGFFGIDGYKSVREPAVFPAAFKRDKHGTDINILGYNAGEDWMSELAKSILDNFWMAVYAADLEAVIRDGDKEILINKATLHDRLEEFSNDNGLIYYRTVISPTKVVKESLPLLGACSLYIRIEDRFPKDIALMRKPKMVVRKRGFRALQDAYAGVFVCDDDNGNLLLRGMEPPEHNEWEEKRDKKNGKQAWTEIKEWIVKALKELAENEGGDPEDIPGLEDLLPYDEDTERTSESKFKSSDSGKASAEETGSEVGAEREEVEDEIEDYIRKSSSLRNATGLEKGTGGRRGGKGGGDGRGTGGEESGFGLSRINTSAIRFRTIYAGNKSGSAEYRLILDPLSDQEGALNIVAIGEDAAVYAMPLAFAQPWAGKGLYKTRGSFISNLKLKKGEQLKIKIGLKSKSRYALGIESYEG